MQHLGTVHSDGSETERNAIQCIFHAFSVTLSLLNICENIEKIVTSTSITYGVVDAPW